MYNVATIFVQLYIENMSISVPCHMVDFIYSICGKYVYTC